MSMISRAAKAMMVGKKFKQLNNINLLKTGDARFVFY